MTENLSNSKSDLKSIKESDTWFSARYNHVIILKQHDFEVTLNDEIDESKFMNHNIL